MSLSAAPRKQRRLKSQAALLGIGLATPPAMTQEQILALAAGINSSTADQRAFLKRIFRNAGIESRGTVLLNDGSSVTPQTFYCPAPSPGGRGPTTAERMERYASAAPPLAVAAARRALDEAGTRADAITHLLTASCTGFMAPGLDVALIDQLHLSPAVRRLHIGFMGCHAAFNLLAAARDVIRADSTARVLVCGVELCTLHLAYGWDPGKLIANALFADGAAAAVIGASHGQAGGTVYLSDAASMLIPDSRDAMTWRIGDHGFEMTLSPGIPSLIGAHIGAWCEKWLERSGLTIGDIAHWAIHPGGPRVLDAVAGALDLPADSLAPSRNILARHGNMSSVTILFILREIMTKKLRGPIAAIGLGPGLMAEGMLFCRTLPAQDAAFRPRIG